MIQRAGSDQYRSKIRTADRRTVRIGFAAQATTATFSHEVSQSLALAASVHGVDLVEVNNRYSA
jgi:hypothetical protein